LKKLKKVGPWILTFNFPEKIPGSFLGFIGKKSTNLEKINSFVVS
jgi:hypothetical protein